MKGGIECRMAGRKATLIMEMIQDKTTVEADRFLLCPLRG